MNFIIKGEERNLYIEYRKKKNVSVNISPEGFLTVRAPNGISDQDLKKAIENMIPRIEKKLKQIEENKKIYEEGSYNDDEKFKLFGDYVAYSDHNLDPKNEIELKKFYNQKLKEVLEDYLKNYSKKMRVSYKVYKINEVKTNWGTCNSDKSLTFNLRLAMAPLEIVEYVVVHELAHLKHLNHDRSFWNLVGRYYPEYKKAQEYLRKYGQFMTV